MKNFKIWKETPPNNFKKDHHVEGVKIFVNLKTDFDLELRN